MESEGRFYAVVSEIEGVIGWSAKHWRAELFDSDGMGYLSHPVAVAYITEYPDSPSYRENFGPSPGIIDYLIVFDHHRREGHAGRLMRAIRVRWPGIERTGRLNLDGTFRGEEVACEEIAT